MRAGRPALREALHRLEFRYGVTGATAFDDVYERAERFDEVYAIQLVSEFVRGQTLTEVLAMEGPLPLHRVLRIFSQILAGTECPALSGEHHRTDIILPAALECLQQFAGHWPVETVQHIGAV